MWTSSSRSKRFAKVERRGGFTRVQLDKRPRAVLPAAMAADDVQELIEEATFDFSLGETDAAVAKLARAIAQAPESFEAWHALAEVNFGARRFEEALAAATRAHVLRPDDIFINTSLSRIWMEKGDKDRAEHFGARARVLGWKDQLKEGKAGGEGSPAAGAGPGAG